MMKVIWLWNLLWCLCIITHIQASEKEAWTSSSIKLGNKLSLSSSAVNLHVCYMNKHSTGMRASHSLKQKSSLFIFKRSWFSKLQEFSLAFLGLKTSSAMLKSLSRAAEASRGAFSSTESLQTAGKDFGKSVWSDEQAKKPSSCLAPSCAWDDCQAERSHLHQMNLNARHLVACWEVSSMCCLISCHDPKCRFSFKVCYFSFMYCPCIHNSRFLY